MITNEKIKKDAETKWLARFGEKPTHINFLQEILDDVLEIKDREFKKAMEHIGELKLENIKKEKEAESFFHAVNAVCDILDSIESLKQKEGV